MFMTEIVLINRTSFILIARVKLHANNDNKRAYEAEKAACWMWCYKGPLNANYTTTSLKSIKLVGF